MLRRREGGGRVTFTLITCSGLSSTGKLTAQTGPLLLRRCGGMIVECVGASSSAASLESAVKNAGKILVLDGCVDSCARKKVGALGAEIHTHIIATECGIEKRGMDDPRFDEIERLAAAVSEVISR